MSHYETLFSITYSFAKLTGLPAIAFARCLPQAGFFLFWFLGVGLQKKNVPLFLKIGNNLLQKTHLFPPLKNK